eukprot:4606135-Lingulodinium_polyedra.AAC.1
MPAEYHDGRRELHKAAHGELNAGAREAARWVEQNGAALGFRPPNIDERSRVMGAAAYLQALQLDNEDLYNAQGNHCDRAVIPQRLAGA